MSFSFSSATKESPRSDSSSLNDAKKIIEVQYENGATPLFKAIEETNWRKALELAENHNGQVKTWIRSSSLSTWRRLPIHEACRRQAPAWFVSSLFAAFPESAYATTQFGELPLHLAVESGAAPEVVNLIMVANWSAIVAPDNSGRIPTDILDRGELLAMDDHRIVHESLSRCHKAYTDIQRTTQQEQDLMKRKHKIQMTKVQRQHQDAMRQEKAKQEEIRQVVSMLEKQIADISVFDKQKNDVVRDCHQKELSWKERAEAYESAINILQEETIIQRAKINALAKEVKAKDADLLNRENMIEILSDDLRKICAIQQEDLTKSVQAAEKAMKAMVSSQITLQKQLVGQAGNLQQLLVERGISQPESSPFGGSEESKDAHFEERPTVDPHAAASALAAAAMAALRKPNMT